MAINIEFTISDINSVITAYDTINVYRAISLSGNYSLIGTIAMVYAKTTYAYTDLDGVITEFYKITYYNTSTTAETALSNALQGTLIDIGFSPMTYPPETSLTAAEMTVVERVRGTLGDVKQLKRDYYDGAAYSVSLGTTTGDNDSYSRVSSDGYTYELEDKGWPVSVVADDTTYNELAQPYVQGYKYLSFSGSSPVFTVTGTFDVHYMQFRFSDKEIVDVYDRIEYIPGTARIDTDSIPASWYYLYAGIKLIESEFQSDAVKSVSVADGDTRYSNEAALSVRQRELDSKRKQLDGEIEELINSLMHNLDGVRVD